MAKSVHWTESIKIFVEWIFNEAKKMFGKKNLHRFQMETNMSVT